MQNTFRDSLATMGFPQGAIDFVVDMWRVTQFFDDVADGDKVDRPDLDAALWACLVGLPDNPFFIAHRTALVPVIACQIVKWQASDKAERDGQADARSYMWRAGFYDLLASVALICLGVDAAKIALSMYGETLDEYLKEFSHA